MGRYIHLTASPPQPLVNQDDDDEEDNDGAVGSFLTIFTSGFQTCSFYKQFWRNKNEHKNHIIKIKEGEEEDVGF